MRSFVVHFQYCLHAVFTSEYRIINCIKSLSLRMIGFSVQCVSVYAMSTTYAHFQRINMIFFTNYEFQYDTDCEMIECVHQPEEANEQINGTLESYDKKSAH